MMAWTKQRDVSKLHGRSVDDKDVMTSRVVL